MNLGSWSGLVPGQPAVKVPQGRTVSTETAVTPKPAETTKPEVLVKDGGKLASATRRFVHCAMVDGVERDLYDLVISEVERALIEEVLAFFGGNQVHAALALGINRMTMRQRMRRFGLTKL